jgi:hypothetical protein
MNSARQPLCDSEQVRRLGELIEQAGLAGRRAEAATASTGAAAIDRLLPHRGMRRGALVEWLADSPGGGASVLALAAAREALRDGGAVVVVDRGRTFYPPAAAAWRLDLAATIVVHPQTEKDEHWTIDQALRCEHVAALLAWPRRLDGRTFRRLQLAAESSGAIGLLVRPAAAEREPSWADVRLAVSPRPSAGGWRLAVRLVRSRGRWNPLAQEALIEIGETTGEIHEAHPRDLAAELARPAARQQQA